MSWDCISSGQKLRQKKLEMLRSKKRDAKFFELRNNIYMAMTGKSLPKAGDPKPAHPAAKPDQALLKPKDKNVDEQLQRHIRRFSNNDPKLQLEGVRGIRVLLSNEKNPPIAQVIEAGITPQILSMLSKKEHPKIVFEALWALTNIASGKDDHTRHVIKLGAVPKFVELLAEKSVDIVEQSIWALGNIAGNAPDCRDLVLRHGAIGAVVSILKAKPNMSTTRNATWALSNFCRGKPQPSLEAVAPALPILAKLATFRDDEVMTDACWALSYICDGPNERIDAVVKSGVVPVLIKVLQLEKIDAATTPALRAIGNIATGNDSQTQCVIDNGGIPALCALTRHKKKGIRKEACWTISNIMAGTAKQIQGVLDSKETFESIVELLKQSEDKQVRKEAAWCIGNATSGGTDDQMKFMIGKGIVQALCELLKEGVHASLVDIAIGSLNRLLKIDKAKDIVMDCGGVERLEALQSHPDENIYSKVLKLLTTHFDVDDV